MGGGRAGEVRCPDFAFYLLRDKITITLMSPGLSEAFISCGCTEGSSASMYLIFEFTIIKCLLNTCSMRLSRIRHGFNVVGFYSNSDFLIRTLLAFWSK